MYGAMIGDLVGSRFEFRHHKSKVFSLFTEDCCFTDDTVMTIGVAEGLMNALPDLIDKIPVIIDKLIQAIVDNLPKIIAMGIELTIQLAVGLVKAIPNLIKAIPQIISSLVTGIASYYSNMIAKGKELLGKIKDGKIE
mgnify:CR=1 FL=1